MPSPRRSDPVEPFEDQVGALLSDVERAITILERTGGPDVWIEWLKQDRERIRVYDVYGLAHLLGAFGGMGSFNDVVLHSMNGNRGSDRELAAANRELNIVRGRIWDRARALLRGHG